MEHLGASIPDGVGLRVGRIESKEARIFERTVYRNPNRLAAGGIGDQPGKEGDGIRPFSF
jgi:hypothetical protein